MGALRTIKYTLSDGQVVTTRQLAKQLGVTESAARNRLNRHTDPKKVFAPYNPSKGGKARKLNAKQVEQNKKDKEQELLKLALQNI